MSSGILGTHTGKLLLAGAACVLIVTSSTPVGAGGLYINEFGTPSMGVAGAGAEAVSSDASTALHNPAGMTRLDTPELMLSSGFLVSTVKFDPESNTPIAGGDGGDAGSVAPILGTFLAYPVTDRLRLGMDVISISGAVLDFRDDWTGRYQVQDVSIITVTLNPSVAYRFTDWFSMGAGVGFIYGELDMDVAAPPPAGNGVVSIDGDDWDVGFNVGALFHPTERLKIGAIYWEEVEPDFDGDVRLSPPNIGVATNTKVPLARFARLGAYYEINEQFALLGTLGWEDWSTMDEIQISAGGGGAALPRNWHDTWKFALGLHYRPAEKWLLQTGFSYDTSPVDASDRSADMPIDRQLRYAVGAQYDVTERLRVGAQFEYADYGKAKIRDQNLLLGEFERNDLFFFAVNANYKF